MANLKVDLCGVEFRTLSLQPAELLDSGKSQRDL